MDYLVTLLKIVCRGYTQEEKTKLLQANGFYSFSAVEKAKPEKIDEFKKFLENEINKTPDYKIVEGYLIRRNQDKPSFMLTDGKSY